MLKTPPSPHTITLTLESHSSVCPRCGTRLINDYDVCPVCANPLADPASKTARLSDNTIWLLILIFVAITIAGLSSTGLLDLPFS